MVVKETLQLRKSTKYNLFFMDIENAIYYHHYNYSMAPIFFYFLFLFLCSISVLTHTCIAKYRVLNLHLFALQHFFSQLKTLIRVAITLLIALMVQL